MGHFNDIDNPDVVSPELPTKDQYDIMKDEIFLKYANKSAPNSKRTRAGLSVYTGNWSNKEIIHLLRRTMFGAKQTDVQSLSSMTPSQAVDYLLNNVPSSAPAPPLNYYENIYADPTNVALGSPWVNAAYGDGTVNYYRRQSLRGWWMENIVNQNTSIEEKMVLFMSNFFPVGFETANEARFLYKYMQLIRQYSLGNLKAFLKELTKDGSMLYYLNGHYNIKNSPDENYARELQELFTIGKDSTTLYTQQDVVEAARILTGWRRDPNNLQTVFDDSLHDTGNKVFSSFYGGTVITGQTGPNGANETDQLIDMIFAQQPQRIAKFFARKLYRFFVYYDIDANIESTIIDGLATTMINNNFEIKPVIEQLLKSDHFFDSLTMDCLIKTPLDFFLGTFRAMNSSVPTSYSIEDRYKCHILFSSLSSFSAMTPGGPPSVSGWPAYYQTPFYHEMWINSDTLPKRMRYTDTLISNNGFYVSATARLNFFVLDFAQSLSNPADPDVVVSECVEYLLGIGLSQTLKDYYKAILLSGQTANSYWTNAWNNYINNPSNTTFEGIVKTRLYQMLLEMLRMAEHHLS